MPNCERRSEQVGRIKRKKNCGRRKESVDKLMQCPFGLRGQSGGVKGSKVKLAEN